MFTNYFWHSDTLFSSPLTTTQQWDRHCENIMCTLQAMARV